MAFDTPIGGDYSSWKSKLEEKVSSACSDERFSLPSLTFGQSLLSSMKSADAVNKLSAWRLHESSIGKYLGSRAGAIVLLVFGFIILIISIVAIFLKRPTWREKWSKLFLGALRERPRPRLSRIAIRDRTRLFGLALIFSAGMMVIAAFTFVGSAQMIQGVNQANCNVWVQLHGHFFGAKALEDYQEPAMDSPLSEIARSWNGTQNIHQSLLKLQEMVTPGDENPIKVQMNESYATLKETMLTLNDTLVANSLGAREMTQILNAGISKISQEKALSWEESDWRRVLALNDVVDLKTDVFITDLNATLVRGFQGIEDLIEKYSGNESQLLNKSSIAVVDSLSTISQVDASIAALTRMWNEQGGTITSLLLAFSSLAIVIAVAVLVGIVFCGLASAKLLKSFKNDALPSLQDRRLWKIACAIFCVCAGCSALFCGINYLASVIGSDVCELLNDNVFEQGAWDLLGEEIIHPFKNMTVDMRTVFDTCVRRDGSGNVAVSLGLDGRIAELNNDVDDAVQDVYETRDFLLDREDKKARSQVLGLAYFEVPEVLYFDHGVASAVPSEAFFNETRTLTMDIKDYSRRGLTNLGFFIPLAKETELLNMIVKLFDLVTKVTSLNAGIDMLNEAASHVAEHTTAPTPQMPRYFCSPLLLANRHSCSDYQQLPSYVEINQTVTIEQLTDWADEAASPIPVTAPLFKGKYDRIHQRIFSLMKEIARIERIGSTKVSDIADIERPQCPDHIPDCTLDEARRNMRNLLMGRREVLTSGVLSTLDLVDEFIATDVIPTMSSVVNDANHLTEDANCQFEGTALDIAVRGALCDSAFSAAAFLTVLFGTGTLVLAALAAITFFWIFYLSDLGKQFENNAELYKMADDNFKAMRSRMEFTSYTGVPTSPAARTTNSSASTASVTSRQDRQADDSDVLLSHEPNASHLETAHHSNQRLRASVGTVDSYDQVPANQSLLSTHDTNFPSAN